MMMKPRRIYGGTSVGNDVYCGENFIGRDMITVTVQQETYLHQIWKQLDADLQDAFVLANNQVIREGSHTITLIHLLLKKFISEKELLGRWN